MASDMKILVMDDDESIRRLTERALTKAGHGVKTIICLDELKKSLANEQFDVYLLDMSGVDGADAGVVATDFIRRKYPDAPVVIMSGVKNSELPGIPFVLKPFELSHLIQTLHDAAKL